MFYHGRLLRLLLHSWGGWMFFVIIGIAQKPVMWVTVAFSFCVSVWKSGTENKHLLRILSQPSAFSETIKNTFAYEIQHLKAVVVVKLSNLILAAPVAEWLRRLISLSPLIIRSSHRCGWCGFEPHTGYMWDKSSSTCGCVRWFFPGYSRFRPTYWLDRLDTSEIILKGTLNWIQKKKKKSYPSFWMNLDWE